VHVYFIGLLFVTMTLILPSTGNAVAIFGSEEMVLAGESPLQVPGYSVPSCTDWNNDGLHDLVVGQGGGGISPAKIAVFLNSGTVSTPVFSSGFFVQSNGSDLDLPASGCMGLFPRVVYWDSDSRKDLLVGTALGNIIIFLNNGTDENPTFDAGTNLTLSGSFPVVIDVGSRATPGFLDWNEDGRRDLVCGAYDGLVHVFLNIGTDTEPVFESDTPAQEFSGNLSVPGSRSSPFIYDFDEDGKKDILTGNTNGQLIFYSNIGTNSNPIFGGNVPLYSDGVPIDLPGTPRSRPFVCDWTGNGLPDILVGASDGLIRLFQSQQTVPVPDYPDIAVTLASPWPNPFNPYVNIEFSLPDMCRVQLEIFDIQGRKVRILADGVFPDGESFVSWDGTDTQHQALPSGMYFVRLKSGKTELQRKVVMVK